MQAVNLATRAVYKATVSTQGEFSIAQLPAGTYQFSALVLANRMLPYVQHDLKVAPGQIVKLCKLYWATVCRRSFSFSMIILSSKSVLSRIT